MSVFAALNPFEDAPGLDPGVGAIMSQAVRLYQREKIGERALGHLFPDEDAELDRKLKRRALGMPMDDEDLEHASNNGLPFFLTGAGYGLERVPDPGFLRPPTGAGNFPFRPLAKGIGHDAARSLPGFLRAFRR